MSQEGSQKSNNSQSESSSSSPSQTPFFQDHQRDDATDFTLFGSPAPTLLRSGTVKRASSLSLRKEKCASVSEGITECEENIENLLRLESVRSPDQNVGNRYRRSLDSTFRRSLESISEHKTKRSFSPTFTLTRSSRYSSSLESFSSDQTDFAIRSTTEIDNATKSITENKEEKTIQSPRSSYLSWMETVKSEFYESGCSDVRPNDFDNKVGEWNNFWLNYNSDRNHYLSSPYQSVDGKTEDNYSDARSSSSTQKDITDKNSTEYISLTVNEIHEALKCSKRITEILENALSRNDHDCENSNIENSICTEFFSRQNSSLREENVLDMVREDLKKMSRETSPHMVSAQDLIRQKELLKKTVQSSSTSCINALLNTGVADILKRVINKRREVMTPDDLSSMTRHSFSEWSSK
ncbi:hypothetical protein JTB14_019444 [Gonioctena quinquepunctata]|nr:hypothetical protein JTB14_019444 [Gonioctena quinquepunctata]